jgi:HlyD family secretion protein
MVRRLMSMSLALLVIACGAPPELYYQGYAEAEYVRVALPFAGMLERLSVQRGAQVKAGDELFVLESGNEAAMRREAE